MNSVRVKNLLMIFGACLVAVLAIALIALALVLRRAALDLDGEILLTGPEIRNTIRGAGLDLALARQHLDRDLIVIGAAAIEWQKASKAQAAYSTDAARKTGEALDAAKELLASGKTSLETIDNLTASATSLIEHTDYDLNDSRTGAIPALQADAFVTTKKLAELIESLTLVTNHADAKIGDPQLSQVLIALLETAKHLEATTGSMQLAADESQKRLHQALKPMNLGLRILNAATGGAVKAAQIGVALK